MTDSLFYKLLVPSEIVGKVQKELEIGSTEALDHIKYFFEDTNILVQPEGFENTLYQVE